MCFSMGASAFAGPGKASDKLPKNIDKALAGALNEGSSKHKVLVTVKPGYRATLRKALELHGDKIKREHGS